MISGSTSAATLSGSASILQRGCGNGLETMKVQRRQNRDELEPSILDDFESDKDEYQQVCEVKPVAVELFCEALPEGNLVVNHDTMLKEYIATVNQGQLKNWQERH